MLAEFTSRQAADRAVGSEGAEDCVDVMEPGEDRIHRRPGQVRIAHVDCDHRAHDGLGAYGPRWRSDGRHLQLRPGPRADCRDCA